MGAAVKYSPDFERIQALPTRVVGRDRGEELLRELTPLLTSERGKTHSLKKVRGRVVEVAEPSRLNWLQAYGIHEAAERNGAYLQLPVGSGKTLLTYLLPFVFDAVRPVLVVPENLIEKTRKEFREYERHWVKHTHPTRIVGLRELTEERNVKMLAHKVKADLYMLDEVDLLSNQESSMAKRLARDISDRNVRTVAMTGTGGRFSILNVTHLITWCLKDHAPVPIELRADGSREVEVWASALDEKTPGDWQARKRRTDPGALFDLIEVDETDHPGLAYDICTERELQEALENGEKDRLTELGLARVIFRKRLNQTEGCIISDEDSCDKQLTIKLQRVTDDVGLERAFKDFRNNRLPNGDVLEDSLRVWAQARCLGLGYFEEWIDPPPDWWNEPRKAYAKMCGKVIKRTAWTMNPLDTRKAVHREFGDHPTVLAWEEVKDLWKGETRPVWLSGSVVDHMAEWGHRNHGLLWTPSIPFGEALGDATGLPFYGAQGLTVSGSDVEYDPGDTSIILSTGANMRGRNLQDRWHRNNIACGVQSARWKEQLMGRTHRFGQPEDVEVIETLTSGDSLYAFQRALVEAEFVYATQGHRQKLLRAKTQYCAMPKGTARWQVKNAA